MVSGVSSPPSAAVPRPQFGLTISLTRRGSGSTPRRIALPAPPAPAAGETLYKAGFRLKPGCWVFAANNQSDGNLGLLPPPLWGRVGEGGSSLGNASAPNCDPHPRPLPTRGRGAHRV